jgi:hypothetical protein
VGHGRGSEPFSKTTTLEAEILGHARNVCRDKI